MLAERTKVEASAPVEENLFEGLSLSLPEVPTAPILVPNTKTSFEPLVNVETEAKLTKPIVKQTTMDLDSHKRKTGSLSALYATEVNYNIIYQIWVSIILIQSSNLVIVIFDRR